MKITSQAYAFFDMCSVFALYERNKVVGALLAIYLIAELAVALWIYATPGAHRQCCLLQILLCKTLF